jgi:hypothetical protein
MHTHCASTPSDTKREGIGSVVSTIQLQQHEVKGVQQLEAISAVAKTRSSCTVLAYTHS